MISGMPAIAMMSPDLHTVWANTAALTVAAGRGRVVIPRDDASAVLRVRSVQEGSFMRAGGVAATFTQQVDAASGRVDIAIVRPGDATGVAGTGLLGAVLFDAVGGGPANLTITGSAAAPRGTPVQLQFNAPPPVAVK